MGMRKQNGKQIGRLLATEQLLYVNDEYRGESDMGKLMHDFNCTKADDMNFELMAERTRYLKEGAINSAKRMLADGILTLEKIAEYVGLPLDEVKKLKTDKMS